MCGQQASTSICTQPPSTNRTIADGDIGLIDPVSNRCLRPLFDIQIDTRRVARRVRGSRNDNGAAMGIRNLGLSNIGRQAKQVLLVDICRAVRVSAATDNHELVYLGLLATILNNGHLFILP